MTSVGRHCRLLREGFQFNERIRPQIDRDVIKDVQRSNLGPLLDITTKHVEVDHKTAMANSKLKLEEYDYQMYVMEFLGLIECSKKQLNPTFWNQVYKKTDFRI